MAFALESIGLWALPQYNNDPGHGHAPPHQPPEPVGWITWRQ
jgi:hypothetical protein